MYHYTYVIRDKTSKMKYIGVRSSECLPLEDTEYWGSSKHLPLNVRDTHKKRVLSTFSTRKEAVQHEIDLHNKYDVANNSSFYNKAKQTSTGFDTSGTTLSEEHLAKMSKALKGKKKSEGHGLKVSLSLTGKKKTAIHKERLSVAHKARASKPNYVNPRKGAVLTDESKAKISQTKLKNGSGLSIKNPRFSPWYIVIAGIRTDYTDMTKSEFAIANGLNPDSFRCAASRSNGKRPVNLKHLGKCIVGNII